LVAKDESQQEKIIMDWGVSVPFKEITKCIAKMKFKKYLKEVNF
jgi:hypothetical protein